METFGEDWGNFIDSIKLEDTVQVSETANQIDAENQKNLKDPKLADYYAKIKSYLNATTISEKQPTLTLTLSAASDVGTVDFNISLTGTSCLQIDTTNLCNGKRTKKLNPQQHPETLTLSPANKKAGDSLLIVEICPPSSTTCVKKTYRITVQPGKLASFTITPDSPTTLAGMLTPLTITAQDANANPIDRTAEEYVISVSAGKLLYEGGYQEKFTLHNFKNLTLYYQAPTTGNASTATIQLASTTGNVITSIQQTISLAAPSVSVNGKNLISAPAQSGSMSITLKNTDTSFTIDANNLKQVNEAALQKVQLQIRDSKNQVIKVQSQVQVTSSNNLLHIGEISEKTVTKSGKNLIQKSFRKKGLFTLEDGQLSFFFYPGTVAGKETLRINIPGLQPLLIHIEILPAPAQSVEIQLAQETLTI
jgi:hypothetical protein